MIISRFFEFVNIFVKILEKELYYSIKKPPLFARGGGRACRVGWGNLIRENDPSQFHEVTFAMVFFALYHLSKLHGAACDEVDVLLVADGVAVGVDAVIVEDAAL